VRAHFPSVRQRGDPAESDDGKSGARVLSATESVAGWAGKRPILRLEIE
jgi:hypothetical protein